MKKRLVFVLGGARSGKSTFARVMAENSGERLLFVATATPGDAEMQARIAAHQAERSEKWHTLEATTHVGYALRVYPSLVDVVLIDCVSMLISNLLLSTPEPSSMDIFQKLIEDEFEEILASYASSQAQWILVSNEVGMGLVPPYVLGRFYRDGLGWMNQQLAQKADEVYFLVSGLPMKLKG